MFDRSRLIFRQWGRSSKRWVVYLLIVMLLPATAAWAKPTSTAQAQRVVKNWLGLDCKPLGTPLGGEIKGVETFRDAVGIPLYHVVYLEPAGLVFVPGDDLVEPIIGYLSEGYFYPSLANCLGALVIQDIPLRVRQARDLERQARAQGQEFPPPGRFKDAQDKWDMLEKEIPDLLAAIPPQTKVSDERVPPLLQSKWSQGGIGGGPPAWCYNYYTPKHYVCGCHATAMAQLMRYFQHPSIGVGTKKYKIWVDGAEQYRSLRGGDGQGGAYDWNNMVLVPDSTTPDHQRQAIGALTHDAGVRAHMKYTDNGSSTSITNAKWALLTTFQYNNLILGGWWLAPLAAINPNLDAALPVYLRIKGDPNHALLTDGYGYHLATLYHHLNMGWGGSDDLWYNLPKNISGFENVLGILYNVFKSGSGEIISGRVLAPDGSPRPGIIVKASGGGQTYQTKTNGRGIYAFAQVPSDTTFTIEASLFKHPLKTPLSIQVTTGKSADYQKVGNVWAANLTFKPPASRNNAYWQHGTKILPEWPHKLVQTARKGWGTIFTGKENTFNWFHIPIPTPVIEENTRTVLSKIFVPFQTIGNVQITSVHVWDGREKIRAFDGLHLAGDHRNIDDRNRFYIWETMFTGVDIVIGVKFGQKINGNYPAILFTTAGGDFYRWW
ncbi:MAG: DUF6623 family protein [Desulfobacteraceae bacterium]